MNLIGARVDIAELVFHVQPVDRHDQLRRRAKLTRAESLDALYHLATVGEVGTAACLCLRPSLGPRAPGGRGKLIGAQVVRPYVESNQNDRVDAEAIGDAMRRLPGYECACGGTGRCNGVWQRT